MEYPSLHDGEGSPSETLHRLSTLSDLEAVLHCVAVVNARRLEDRDVARAIIDAGLSRGVTEAKKVEEKVASGSVAKAGTQTLWTSERENELSAAIDQVVGDDVSLRQLITAYGILHQARAKLDTYEMLSPRSIELSPQATVAPSLSGDLLPVEDQHVDLDDPWAENGNGNENDESGPTEPPVIDDPWEISSTKSELLAGSPEAEPSSRNNHPEDLPMSLADFLADSVLDSAILCASSAMLRAMKLLLDRHASVLGPYRFALLDHLPAWVSPGEIKEAGLLPMLEDEQEAPWYDSSSTSNDVLYSRYPQVLVNSSDVAPTTRRLTGPELSQWFIGRVDSLDQLGMLDMQLAWVQHGASMGIPNLDSLGEDLSLLSRLIYDANLTPAQHAHWTLAAWRTASDTNVVGAYLSSSTPTTIVSDIRRLVLPYLYVLESRAEREGRPDAHLVERLLYQSILSLSLQMALPVFEASKATVPMSERLVRNDQNVARLALACLYGSDERNVWSTMSSIFECLPVWDVSGGDLESDKEATSTTLESIATFVRPTTSSAKPPSAQDLYFFFSPLPFASLSRALDILDVHLESGEILARWNTAVQLRFLLQSSRDKDEQVQLAEKMVRRQSGSITADQWPKLWQDMCRLNGGDDALLRGAFGMLSMDELMSVYLGGVLSAGNFNVARKMIRQLEIEHELSSSTLEAVALSTSRELYDNAETGNIHTGEMKVAYECLAIPPSSPALQKERAFIEATSRLASFAKLTLSPFQIRHAKNKLDLIRRILSTSDDAFRHDSIILDLADKLGLANEVARAQILGMLADSAVTHLEYDIAFAHAQKLVSLVKDRHKRRTPEDEESIRDVTYKTCLELGRQDDWPNIEDRMLLLGRAVEYCPSESIPSILVTWHQVEDGALKLSQAAKRRRLTGIKQPYKPVDRGSTVVSPVIGSQEERVLGSRTAARAARMALGFGERFKDQIPFGSGLSPRLPSLPSSREGSRDRAGEPRRSIDSDRVSLSGLGFGARDQTDAERVSRHARRALVKGVGWLLGADERELQ